MEKSERVGKAEVRIERDTSRSSSNSNMDVLCCSSVPSDTGCRGVCQRLRSAEEVQGSQPLGATS